jgi:2-keto-4-pentenoate hydratase/2-oxohepta-3-ene-1,7-dioic acid hydratase in catechol pathway
MMRLATFTPPDGGPARAGEVRGGQVVSFATGDVLERLRSGELAPADGDQFALGEVKLLAPYKPRAVLAVGTNYLAHARERGQEPPDEPAIFFKGPGSVTGPSGPVRRPHGTEQLDYEAELAVVVGRNGSIAGYAVANDISARDWQRGDNQWWRAKGSDTFCPFGPWITTPDELADPYSCSIRTWVNGQLRQDANTVDMIFRAEQVIEFISVAVALSAGDLILTGTPHGVGAAMSPPCFLTPGDLVRVEIEGLGAIENQIIG